MIDTTNIHNMPRLLAALETDCGSRTILKYLDGNQVCTVSGTEFWRAVRRCAGMLGRQGLSGRHIGIMGANRTQWLVHFCAVFQIGAVAVLLGPDLNATEFAERAELADLSCILHDEALLPVVSGSPLIKISMDAPLPDSSEYSCIADPEAGELACILFTSGTTTAGKAVMLSHSNMVAGSCHNVVGHHFDAQLAILPMHHVAGFATVLNTWYLGALVCLGQDFKYIYRYLEAMKPDYTLTVPSLLQAILRKLKKGGPNGAALGWNLKLIGCGGAKFQPEVIQALNSQNIRVLQSYGATEAGGLGFDWEMTPACQDTIGKPCPEIETKIVDGELYLRSPSVMMGYYKDPEGTAEVLHDGWYATGDLCRQDGQGYLYLTGRKKNLIILSGGENVSPEEIEARLSACSAVCEVMVGLEQGLITATIYPDSSRENPRAKIEAAVAAYNAGVPPYKQVQTLHFSDVPFAKTAVGKMIRRSVMEGDTK